MKTSTARRREEHLEPASASPSLADRIRSTPTNFRYGNLFGLGGYLGLMHFTSGLRWEQFLACGIFLFVSFWSNNTRRFAILVLPLLLYGIAYDLSHLTEPLVRNLTVHVTEPYQFDKTYFGVQTSNGVITPNEYFATHHWPAVDFVTGLSYILYLWWQIAFGIYFAATAKTPDRVAFTKRFGWAFLGMNLVAFMTYYIYPSAPPWYVADYGFGPVNFDIHASAAGAARWDALTGIPYFAGFYGRSADIFGAIPSLHVAGPLLVAIYAAQLRNLWLTIFAYSFFLLVSFAAVYLQHHYVLDVLVGSLYAVGAWGAERLVSVVWRPDSSTTRPAEPSPT